LPVSEKRIISPDNLIMLPTVKARERGRERGEQLRGVISQPERINHTFLAR
jgi:hypothetical protein